MGPLLLVQAGIPLVDLPDDSLFKEVKDGDRVELRGAEVWVRGEPLVRGDWQDPHEVLAATDRRRKDIGGALEAFARNTVEHMVEEQRPAVRQDRAAALRHGLPRPARADRRPRRRPPGRPAALRPFIRDISPVLVGVDGGANAILEAGCGPT